MSQLMVKFLLIHVGPDILCVEAEVIIKLYANDGCY